MATVHGGRPFLLALLVLLPVLLLAAAFPRQAVACRSVFVATGATRAAGPPAP